MSDFENLKAAIALLSECADGANNPGELVEALAARRDNPFYNIDFWAYAVALQNAVQLGLDEAMNLLGDNGGEAA